MEIYHVPVMAEEILKFIDPNADNIKVIDATTGEGGHAELFLRHGYSVFAVDRDAGILARAKERLGGFERIRFALCTNDSIDQHLLPEWAGDVDLVLFDLGVSMYHFRNARLGFSFQVDGPLDMRLSGDGLSAKDVVNGYSEDELARIFAECGEIPYAARIAKAIVRARKVAAVETTKRLEQIVFSATPRKHRFGRIHPATRAFQAIRIEVNDELGILARALAKTPGYLRIGGILSVLSYHSLEDRIVKRFLREHSVHAGGEFEILTKHVITASDAERRSNPASRSAKLRAARKVSKETAQR